MTLCSGQKIPSSADDVAKGPNMTAEPAAPPAKLDRLAEISVRIGVNLQPGQELIINAPVEAVEMVRLMARHAYRAGARDVLVNFADQMLARIQVEDGRDEIFDHAPAWRYDGTLRAMREGAAVLNVVGADPNLMAGLDSARMSRGQKAHARAAQQIRALISGFVVNWTIVPFAHPAWAKAVFPQLSQDEAVAALWNAIFAATRTEAPGAVENWRGHVARLQERTEILNAKQYEALHFRGPGTDLRVGLIQNHVWAGGDVSTTAGLRCLPNIPTEEVFCMPHRDRVDGVVRATKPLSYAGTLIDDIAVRFESGRIVEAKASRGEDAFKSLIATDEGASRLGEVALVPHKSPISESGLLFFNTLFDENAASHIAVGRALAINAPGAAMDNAEGANESLVHVDWMIGSGEIDVDGVRANGEVEAVMREGAFV
jgi:aminopeptidase